MKKQTRPTEQQFQAEVNRLSSIDPNTVLHSMGKKLIGKKARVRSQNLDGIISAYEINDGELYVSINGVKVPENKVAYPI